MPPDWIVRIGARDQIEKVRGDRKREFVAREQNAAALFLVKIDMLLELSERCYPIFELPFPIVPEFRRNIRPVAWRVRSELFPIPFSCRESNHCNFENEKVKSVNNRVNAGT